MISLSAWSSISSQVAIDFREMAFGCKRLESVEIFQHNRDFQKLQFYASLDYH